MNGRNSVVLSRGFERNGLVFEVVVVVAVAVIGVLSSVNPDGSMIVAPFPVRRIGISAILLG